MKKIVALCLNFRPFDFGTARSWFDELRERWMKFPQLAIVVQRRPISYGSNFQPLLDVFTKCTYFFSIQGYRRIHYDLSAKWNSSS